MMAWLLSMILAIAMLVQFSSILMSYRLEVDQSKIIATDQSRPFRLGMRIHNLVCLIDPFFFKKCIANLQFTETDFRRVIVNNNIPLAPLQVTKTSDLKNLLERNNRLFFFPFQYDFSRRPKLFIVIFTVWILLLIITLVLTIMVLSTELKKLRKDR